MAYADPACPSDPLRQALAGTGGLSGAALARGLCQHVIAVFLHPSIGEGIQLKMALRPGPNPQRLRKWL